MMDLTPVVNSRIQTSKKRRISIYFSFSAGLEFNKRNHRKLEPSYSPSNLQHFLCAKYFEQQIFRLEGSNRIGNLIIGYQ